ncbi:MAG: hypothetical protein JWP97_6269 [Labilithrix sp.]|nr:hypothetical protein [Labilithrix sp.]
MADFPVSDATELHLLVRALIEAKLPVMPRDGDLAASPIVARLAERASSAHGEEPSLPGAKGDWRKFSPDHVYWDAAVSRSLLDADWLRKATREQRQEYVALLVSPFQATEEVLAALLERIEGILAVRRSYELWLRAGRPHDGGVLVVREQEDGTLLVHDHAKTEVLATKNRFDLWEWLNERGFLRVGCYVEEQAT